MNYPEVEGGTGGNNLSRYARLCLEVDLNDLGDYRPPSELGDLLDGRNVIVLASEIIEHLTIDISVLLSFWAKVCANSNGAIVVTTPNFLSESRMEVVARGLNQQERYRDRERYKAGFMHPREYGPAELLDAAPSLGLSNGTCALSFAMPGNLDTPNHPGQLPLDQYLAKRSRFTSAATSDKGFLFEMLRNEGLVATYPLPNSR